MSKDVILFCPEDEESGLFLEGTKAYGGGMFLKGTTIYTQGQIVLYTPGSGYCDPPYAEPILNLGDVDAILEYIKGQFPEGWKVVDGEVVSAKPDKAQEEDDAYAELESADYDSVKGYGDVVDTVNDDVDD